ncbi:MAG: FtsQ-type POTRA domain-containing protein [Ruminococcaceae bacterium]|jgi:cell division protein FtsQ|nr:FtsQ-type POTRA domain-containing protein [Oscillospiraceae bacterium]
MARHSRRNRRSRRGRFAFLYRLLTFVVICGAIVAALALFFKIETIEVTGTERYSSEEVMEASGLSVGDNLFLMDKYEVAERVRSALSYVETVQISRSLPSTLRITVTECAVTVAVEQDDVLWLVAGTGKIVDTITPGTKEFALVTGLTLQDPQIGRTIAAEDGDACAVLLDLLQHLRSKDMLGDVDAIRLEDPAVITLEYLDRFRVQIPWNADMNYKLNYLLAVVERLEDNEHGTINMSRDDRVNFIPD